MRLMPSLAILVTATLCTYSAAYSERQSYEAKTAVVLFKTEDACGRTAGKYGHMKWIEGKTLTGDDPVTQVYPERSYSESWKCEFVPSQGKWAFVPTQLWVQEFKVAKGTKMYGSATVPIHALWMSSLVVTAYSFCQETMQVVKSEVHERSGSVLQYEKPPVKQSNYFVPKLLAIRKQTESLKRYTKLNDPCSPLSQPFVVYESKGSYPASTHADFIEKEPSDPSGNEFLSWLTVIDMKSFPRERGGK